MKRESLRLILISDGGKVLTWSRINVGGLVYWRALAILRQLATGIATMGQSWKSLGKVLGMQSQGLVVLVCLEKTWQSAKIREAEGRNKTR